ncbi:MAG: hypothetical protein IJ619_08340 [Eubacterium sp.]|nr:hypothetical protein [Eubacterium sp.]
MVSRKFDIGILITDLLAIIIISALFMPKAESVSVVPIFVMLYFPTLFFTFFTELLFVIYRDLKFMVLVGFILNIAGTVMMAAYWALMILVGGSRNMPLGIAVVGVNMLMAVLMGFNRKRIKVYENGGDPGEETWRDRLINKLTGKKPEEKKKTVYGRSATKKKRRKNKKKK